MQFSILYILNQINRYNCLIFIALCFSGAVWGQIFEPVYEQTGTERLTRAQAIYYRDIVHLPEVEREAELKSLEAFATENKDWNLWFQATFWLGRHYKWEENTRDTAISYYKSGLATARQRGIKEWEARFTYSMADCFFMNKDYNRAFECYIAADEQIMDIGYDRFPQVDDFLYEIGRAYYDFADYDKAKTYLLEALKHPFVNNGNAINIYNTLGLICRTRQENEYAIHYFREALDKAHTEADSAWIGIISGNLGFMYAKAGMYHEAVPLLFTDYRLSIKCGEYGSAALSLLAIAEYYLHIRQPDSAIVFILEAQAFTDIANRQPVFREFYRVSALYYAHSGFFEKAYQNQLLFIQYNDSILAGNDRHLLKNIELRISTDRYLVEKSLRESERRKQQIMLYAGVTILLLVLIVFYQVVRRQRLKRENEKKLYELNRKNYMEALAGAQASLSKYMENIREKNLLIEKFRNEVERLTKSSNSQEEGQKDEVLDQLYHSVILTEQDWHEFRHLFEKVHQDFFHKLKTSYPDLTISETRLLALMKLRLPVNEIAHMLGISPNSVRKTSQRLRKKLLIESTEELDKLVDKL